MERSSDHGNEGHQSIDFCSLLESSLNSYTAAVQMPRQHCTMIAVANELLQHHRTALFKDLDLSTISDVPFSAFFYVAMGRTDIQRLRQDEEDRKSTSEGTSPDESLNAAQDVCLAVS